MAGLAQLPTTASPTPATLYLPELATSGHYHLCQRLVQLGLCLRCCLRFVNVRSHFVYQFSDEFLLEYFQKRLNMILPSDLLSVDGPTCLCCLGILQRVHSQAVPALLAFLEENENFPRDHPNFVDFDGFTFMMVIPISLLIRQFAIAYYIESQQFVNSPLPRKSSEDSPNSNIVQGNLEYFKVPSLAALPDVKDCVKAVLLQAVQKKFPNKFFVPSVNHSNTKLPQHHNKQNPSTAAIPVHSSSSGVAFLKSDSSLHISDPSSVIEVHLNFAKPFALLEFSFLQRETIKFHRQNEQQKLQRLEKNHLDRDGRYEYKYRKIDPMTVMNVSCMASRISPKAWQEFFDQMMRKDFRTEETTEDGEEEKQPEEQEEPEKEDEEDDEDGDDRKRPRHSKPPEGFAPFSSRPSAPDTPASFSAPATLSFSFQRQPILVSGNYCKFTRELSQTLWLDSEAERITDNSVAEEIVKSIIPMFACESYKFHSSGREDADVRMLGGGRPFFIEILQARRIVREAAVWRALEDSVNSSSFLVSINGLQLSDKFSFNAMKSSIERKKKNYRCVVFVERAIGKIELAERLNLQELKVVQPTPLRVLHRRSALNRPKMIHWQTVEWLSPHWFILDLCTSSGTYVKEFVHGDRGRTSPSIASLLGCAADIVQLDVTGFID